MKKLLGLLSIVVLTGCSGSFALGPTFTVGTVELAYADVALSPSKIKKIKKVHEDMIKVSVEQYEKQFGFNNNTITMNTDWDVWEDITLGGSI